MKTMMTMVAVVLTAIFTQAGQVNWSMSGLDTAAINNTFSGTDLSGAIVYGFLGDNVLAAAAGTAAQGGAATFASFLTGNAGSTFGTALTSGTGFATKVNAGTIANGASFNLFLVAFDTATYDKAGHYLLSNVKTQSTPGAGGAMTVQFTVANGGYTALWTNVVPEPTSMALLALGVAVVGLRRKFNK